LEEIREDINLANKRVDVTFTRIEDHDLQLEGIHSTNKEHDKINEGHDVHLTGLDEKTDE